MRPRVSSLTRIALLASLVGQSALVSPIAQSDDITPLTGQVSSAEEGAMEGVLVSAKKSGSTWTTTVVSDAQGRYRFPRTKLDSGQYALAVRAIGYDTGRRPERVGRRSEDNDGRSQIAQDTRSRGPAHERRMARQLSRHRRAESLRSRMRALPHPRTGHPIEARCGRIRRRYRADVRVPTSRVSTDAAANASAQNRRRRRRH